MNRRHRDVAEGQGKADMTPMIDCVFLLIVFFLCIDFKVLEAKLPAFLPKDLGSDNAVVEPQEKLNVMIVCTDRGHEVPRRRRLPGEVHAGQAAPYRLEGHTIHWQVGPEVFGDKDRLRKELERIAADPHHQQPDAVGELGTMGVVIEPGPWTTYGDVAETLDAVHQAGFEEIRFGGGKSARRDG